MPLFHFIISSWDAALKMNIVKLELIIDIDMLQFI